MNQEDEPLLQRLRGYAGECLHYRMSKISERLFAAGWMADLEYDLWAAIQPGTESHYYWGRLSVEECADLLQLARDAGVWWCWDEERGDETCLSLEAWEALFRIRRT